MKYFEPTTEFRDRYNYSNLCYTSAGFIIGEKVGSKWEDLVFDKIFKPLKMSQTLLSVKDMQQTKDYATPYIDWGEGIEAMDFYDADVFGPAGSIISNVEDLSNWVLFHLSSGKFEGMTLLDEKYHREMFVPVIPIPRQPKYPEQYYSNYGLGWFIDNYRQNVHIHHGGVLFGFTSLVSFLPLQKIGVVILANKNLTQFVYALEKYVYDRILQLQPIDWNKRLTEEERIMNSRWKEMMEEEKRERESREILPHKLSLIEYCGNYNNDGYGLIIINKNEKGLIAEFTTIDCPLNHYSGEEFDCYHEIKHQSWRFVFHFDESSKVNGFSVVPAPGMKPVFFLKSD
jgi:CubicO group peptidase (beta-lactamase class C family)